jgi:hypothetical protein
LSGLWTAFEQNDSGETEFSAMMREVPNLKPELPPLPYFQP